MELVLLMKMTGVKASAEAAAHVSLQCSALSDNAKSPAASALSRAVAPFKAGGPHLHSRALLISGTG